MFNKGTLNVQNQVQERIQSPLSGAFIISWVITNYQFILVVFSDMDIERKLNFIHETLYPLCSFMTYNNLVIQPFLAASLYILLYPKIGKYFYAYARKQQHILNIEKQKVDGAKLLSIDESRKIMNENIGLKNRREKAEKDLKEVSSQLETVNREKYELETKIKNLESNKKELG